MKMKIFSAPLRLCAKNKWSFMWEYDRQPRNSWHLPEHHPLLMAGSQRDPDEGQAGHYIRMIRRRDDTNKKIQDCPETCFWTKCHKCLIHPNFNWNLTYFSLHCIKVESYRSIFEKMMLDASKTLYEVYRSNRELFCETAGCFLSISFIVFFKPPCFAGENLN